MAPKEWRKQRGIEMTVAAMEILAPRKTKRLSEPVLDRYGV